MALQGWKVYEVYGFFLLPLIKSPAIKKKKKKSSNVNIGQQRSTASLWET